ncbi:MAG TPA: hypothetical protein VF395_19500, partial [Polyangiaceae bacterium]
MVWQGDRLSLPVPDTVPPDDRAAPGFLPQAAPGRLATVALPAKTKTASMPAARELPFAPTAVATHGPGALLRRRRVWPWVVLVFLVLAASGFGVWAFFNPSVFEDDALPPLPGPGPLPTAVAPPAPATPPVVEVQPSERALPPPSVRPATPLPRPPSAPTETLPSGTGAPPKAGTAPSTAPTFPQFPFPFPIPSGLIPSSLPSFIPQIPGWTVPATPPSAGAAAPAVSPPATGGAAVSPTPSTTGP